MPASFRLASGCRIGLRAGRAVDVVGGGIVREQEAQLVVDVRERRVHDLRRHEVGEHLLHPHVVEPAHRDEIAEPHVRRLVRDDAGAARAAGSAVADSSSSSAGGVVEDRARVLHAAELERRDQHEVELAERIRDAGVVARARRAPRRADRRSRRGCAPPSPRRSRDGTSGTCGRCARRVSTENLPGGEREEIGRRAAASRRTSRTRPPAARRARQLGAVGDRLPIRRARRASASSAP